MPKTHVKKRIKMQYTRKNDKMGGAGPRVISEPTKGYGRQSLFKGLNYLKTKVAGDESKLYTKELIDSSSKVDISIQMKNVFKYSDNNTKIDNYDNFKYYKGDIPVKVFIVNKTNTPIQCIPGIFEINGYILNQSNKQEIKLIIKQDGYSAMFHSNNFDFKIIN